jgi:hypothetical protein
MLCFYTVLWFCRKRKRPGDLTFRGADTATTRNKGMNKGSAMDCKGKTTSGQRLESAAQELSNESHFIRLHQEDHMAAYAAAMNLDALLELLQCVDSARLSRPAYARALSVGREWSREIQSALHSL